MNKMQHNQSFKKIVKSKPPKRELEDRDTKRKRDSKPWERRDKRKDYE